MNANIMPLSERPQRKNLRDMAHMAQMKPDKKKCPHRGQVR